MDYFELVSEYAPPTTDINLCAMMKCDYTVYADLKVVNSIFIKGVI